MKKLTIVCVISFITVYKATASDLKIEQVQWQRENNKLYAQLQVSWKNAWRNENNHDAVWLFFKLMPNPYTDNNTYNHVKVEANGHRLIKNQLAGSPEPIFEVAKDHMGLFIMPAKSHRGNISWRISIALENTEGNLYEKTFAAYGLEMVSIPQGKFTLGEADTTLLKTNFTFFLSGGKGEFKGLFPVNAETEEIKVSPDAGSLYYHSKTKIYNGDQTGVIPKAFPKGFQAFYLMKYELTQGQYADFLNCISVTSSFQRANFGGKDYEAYRGSISLKDNVYLAKSPDRPANFISWDDAMAYADWAALRPYTELEYEKACRGPLKPVNREFPWNTSSKEKLIRYVNKQDELVFANGVEESTLSNTNKEEFGASYYWVMDLSGSVWERVITIGDSTGRAFKGTHGDGLLKYGFANNTDWPVGCTETSGFGFRGGGYYHHDQLIGDLNPNATLANRTFGAWSGGMRSLAYGSRFARTKD
ncbi:formylglycine-generating enzyme family protein [Emticicia agri]|uniref:Formylglycine-generating enzyme family protein n=1 Tax=Emticicia agri TaxID=2492393 RepID=A0A4Q5LUR0_9BACT|nr:formylglycine-generating enzyme family protein [Emticicia agri]RYU93431.1 formylglycine-generating enzyme family protein [Emticicia agri]